MWPCMKLKHLEARLQTVQPFDQPKILLEQYVTPSHLSSQMLFTIQSQYDDIRDKTIADLGCGSGSLAIGCGLLDAAFVLGFEIDAKALETFSENVEDQGLSQIDAVQGNVLQLPTSFHKRFDTVVMNPPFGTKHNAGIDMKFLEIATGLAQTSVYSLHKTTTRAHVLKTAESLGVSGEVLAELRYDLPQTYKFHKQKSVDIQVDFIRFSCD